MSSYRVSRRRGSRRRNRSHRRRTCGSRCRGSGDRGGGNNNNDSGPTYKTVKTPGNSSNIGLVLPTVTTDTVNVDTGEIVDSDTVSTGDLMNGAYQSLLGRDKDPGGGLYWTEQIQNETDLDLNDTSEENQAAVIAYLAPFFEETTEGKQVEELGIGNQSSPNVILVEEIMKNDGAICSYTQITIDYENAKMEDGGGSGVTCPAGEDPLGQSF